jgi:predicted nucleotidyltransferase
MVEISDIVISKIKRFIAELEKNSIHVQKAVLFGSHAKGTSNEWSDIDLAIVSDDFSGDRFDDKARIRPFKKVVGWDISAVPFRVEDFENSLFVRDEILKYGREIC